MRTYIGRPSQMLVAYLRMARRYADMLAGWGYAHVGQSVGRHFVTLLGFYELRHSSERVKP
jgi:hypothetical protein